MLGRGGLSAFAQRGLGTLYALLLDFKNGIYQQTRTRTNLLLWSQAMATSPWTNSEFPSNTVLTNNAGTAPDGSSTATSVSPGTQFGNAKQSVNLTPGVTYTYSVWIKVLSGNTSLSLTNYNAATYLAGNNGSQINTISATSIWQRYSSTFTVDTRIVGSSSVYVQDRNASGFGTFLVWGAQLEAAPAASAYIPTTSAAVSVTESITDPTKLVTNYLLRSQNFASTWVQDQVTLLSGATTAPDGTATMDTIVDNTVSGGHDIGQSITPIAGLTYTASIYLKQAALRYVMLQLSGGGLAAPAAVMLDWNTLSLTVVNGSFASTPTITVAGNGCYRISCSATTSSTAALTFTVYGANGSGYANRVYAGTTQNIVSLWGAQLEQAFTAGTYVPTTSVPVTVGAVTNLYGYTYSRSGAKEEVGTTYGPELVTNGTFDTATGWTLGDATTTISGGKLNFNNTSSQFVTSAVPMAVGKTYQVNCDVVVTSGTNFRLPYDGSVGNIQTATATGHYATTFTCNSGSNTLYVGYPTTFTGSIDNISVKEVIPASSFAANVPAIIPGTGYFARPAYTNLLTYSQDFTQANWTTAQGVLIKTAGIIAPDGSSTATKVSTGGTGLLEYGFSQGTVAASTTYTASMFMKAGDYNFGYIRVNLNGTWQNCWFNLSTGAVSSNGVTGATPTIVAIGNGWYRCILTFTTGTTPNAAVDFGFAPSDGGANNAFTPASTGLGIYIWQAQLVQASDPGPIIVTTSATAAVGADVLNLGKSPVATDQDFIMYAVQNFKTANNNTVVALSQGTVGWNFWLGKNGSNDADVAVVGQTALTIPGACPVGRSVVLYRRRAGKNTIAAKSPTGTVTIGTETGVIPWGGAATDPLLIGNYVDNGYQGNEALEYAAIRPGTFSDTDLTNILTAL